MYNLVDVWARIGTTVSYPGIVQTDQTCVFSSVAGAINFLAGTTISERELLDRWKAESYPTPSFDTALRYVEPQVTTNQIRSTRYHDTENALTDPDIVRGALANRGVGILSLELARQGGNEGIVRLQKYHMISVFNLQKGACQIWDTNNKVGFIKFEELWDLLCRFTIAIPYDHQAFLLTHDKHESLFLTKNDC